MKKTENLKKTETFIFRMSTDDASGLENIASRLKMNKSTLIRFCISRFVDEANSGYIRISSQEDTIEESLPDENEI